MVDTHFFVGPLFFSQGLLGLFCFCGDISDDCVVFNIIKHKAKSEK